MEKEFEYFESEFFSNDDVITINNVDKATKYIRKAGFFSSDNDYKSLDWNVRSDHRHILLDINTDSKRCFCYRNGDNFVWTSMFIPYEKTYFGALEEQTNRENMSKAPKIYGDTVKEIISKVNNCFKDKKCSITLFSDKNNFPSVLSNTFKEEEEIDVKYLNKKVSSWVIEYHNTAKDTIFLKIWI